MPGHWIGTPYLREQLMIMMKENTPENKDYNEALWTVFNFIVAFERKKTQELLED